MSATISFPNEALLHRIRWFNITIQLFTTESTQNYQSQLTNYATFC
jgi:hypothetical protein